MPPKQPSWIKWIRSLSHGRYLAYLATALGMLHFLMVGKVYTVEVLTYAAILTALLAIRVWRNGPRSLLPV